MAGVSRFIDGYTESQQPTVQRHRAVPPAASWGQGPSPLRPQPSKRARACAALSRCSLPVPQGLAASWRDRPLFLALALLSCSLTLHCRVAQAPCWPLSSPAEGMSLPLFACRPPGLSPGPGWITCPPPMLIGVARRAKCSGGPGLGHVAVPIVGNGRFSTRSRLWPTLCLPSVCTRGHVTRACVTCVCIHL